MFQAVFGPHLVDPEILDNRVSSIIGYRRRKARIVTFGSCVTEGLERRDNTPHHRAFKDSQSRFLAELITRIVVSYVSACKMNSLKTLLVANRGEIAVRILKTAKYVALV